MLVNTDLCKCVLKLVKIFTLNEKSLCLSSRSMSNDWDELRIFFISKKLMTFEKR